MTSKKKVATVPASASVVLALEEMRKYNYEAVLIDPVDNERPLVFSEYSIISKLLDKNPSDYGAFLGSPCLLYCLSGGTVGKDSDLQSLFHVYESTTFGYAMIHDETGKIFAMVSVNDLLHLYAEKVLSSNLKVSDVTSKPVFSMSRGSKILDCLREMHSRKFRKVKLANGPLLITDKEIFSYLFNPERLERISKSPQHLLDGTLEDLDAAPVDWIDGNSTLAEAAWQMDHSQGKFLLSEDGLLTPWDLIIKSWRLGDLRISNTSRIDKKDRLQF